MLIPKFYHSKKYDVIKHSARAVGFWRRTLLFFLPYSTRDIIQVYVEVTRTSDEWWQQGILRIDPPEFYDRPILGERIASSDFRFAVEEIQVGEKWSRTLPLKGGTDFGKPCHIVCSLDLEKTEGDRTSIDTIRIATIEVVRGWALLTTIIAALTLLAAIASIILYVF